MSKKKGESSNKEELTKYDKTSITFKKEFINTIKETIDKYDYLEYQSVAEFMREAVREKISRLEERELRKKELEK